MENNQNQSNFQSSAIVPVARRIRPQPKRSARAMAIIAGGVLAVAAAVRVTTARGTVLGPIDLEGPSTQPAMDPTLADDSRLPDDAKLPDGKLPEDGQLTEDDKLAAAAPTTAPTALRAPSAHILDVQYVSAADTLAPATAPAEMPAQSESPSSGMVSSGVDKQGRVTIDVNKSAVITTRFPYKRISIGQPEIADFNAIASGTILITGKKAGTTQLILWDDSERSQVIDIEVVYDVGSLQKEIKAMFPGVNIEVKSLNGSIALAGHVPSAKIADEAIALASPYAAKVLNFMEISGGQQVQLQVKFAEVDRTATSELGINLGFTDGVGFGGTNIGPSPFANGGTSVLAEALDPASVGVAGEGGATQFGHIRLGKSAVDVFVDALRQNNLLRVLAEPNLIAISGQNASFLAGGSFPYPVAQASGGGTTTTIEFQNYGVTLNFVPIVLGGGRIRLKVAPQVSELDYAHQVSSAGTEVPGLTVRQIETTVEMNEGQTFAIAGLLQNNQSGSKSVTPLLGDLPVLGPLFRSVKYQRSETELVVLVTPRLVEALNPDQVPTAPGEHWRDPSENDLYINRDIGGEVDVHGATTRPATDGHPAATFHGHYGFAPATNQTVQTTDDARETSAASTN